jgi:hypothetical protein
VEVRVHDRQRLSLGCVTCSSSQRRSSQCSDSRDRAGARPATLARLLCLVAATRFSRATPTSEVTSSTRPGRLAILVLRGGDRLRSRSRRLTNPVRGGPDCSRDVGARLLRQWAPTLSDGETADRGAGAQRACGSLPFALAPEVYGSTSGLSIVGRSQRGLQVAVARKVIAVRGGAPADQAQSAPAIGVVRTFAEARASDASATGGRGPRKGVIGSALEMMEWVLQARMSMCRRAPAGLTARVRR